MTEGRQYWAFISYSHADEAWARWLHQSIETYRVPRHLVGRALGDEKVPRRLLPVFRDRDELPSSHQLSAVIDRALAGSRNLIVICSPRSATSRWVQQEIAAFRAHGRGHRLFCLIVDGDPQAAPGSASACFAPVLCEGGFEPIAADAREGKDGKAAARLKLIAGLIDVGYDELKQREKQRQLRRRWVGGALAASLVAAAVAGQQAFERREAARTLEARIEKLYDAGRRELLNHYESRAAVYLTEAYRLGRDTPALRVMLGQAMQPMDAQTGIVVQAGAAVRRAAFSPDGTRFVTPAQTIDAAQRSLGTVAQVWDTASGRRIATLAELPASPLIGQFLDAGRVLVSGYTQESIAESRGEGAFTGIWDAESGLPLLRLPGHSGRYGQPVDRAHRFAITADAPDNGAARLWSLPDGKQARTLDPGARVLAASLSPDGRHAATGDAAGLVYLWNLAASGPRRLPGVIPHHVTGVLFTADGRRVLAAGRLGDVRVWDVASAELLLAFAADPAGFNDLALSHDGRTLVTAGTGGYKVWDLERGILLFARDTPLTQWASLALSHDGDFVVTTDNAQTSAELLSVPARRLLQRFEQRAPLSAAAFTADGTRLLTATEAGEVRLWRLPLQPALTLRHATGMAVLAAQHDPSGARVLTAGHDRTLRLWSWPEGRPQATFDEGSKVQDASFSPDGSRIASLTADGVVRIRDAGSGEVLASVQRPPSWNPFNPIRWSPDSRWLVVLGDADDPGMPFLELHRAADGGVERSVETGCRPTVAGFVEGGATLVIGCLEGALGLWDTATGAQRVKLAALGTYVRRLATGSGSVAAFADADPRVHVFRDDGTPAGEYVAPAGLLPQAVALSPADGELAVALGSGAVVVKPAVGVPRTIDSPGPVNGLRYVADGLLLGYRTDDHVATLWDTHRGEPLVQFGFSAAMVWTAEPAPDGKSVLLGDRDGRASAVIIAPERRSVAELQALLRCRAPWVLDGATLQVAAAPASECPREPQS